MKGRWDTIKSILASDVKADERATLLVIALISDFHEMSECRFTEERGRFSMTELAFTVGVSRSRMVAIVRGLEAAGWLKVTRSDARARERNTYEITVPRAWRSKLPNYVFEGGR